MKLIVKSIVAVPAVSLLIIPPGPGCHQAVAQFEEIHADAPLTDPAAQETVAAVPFAADRPAVNPKPNEFKPFSMSPVDWRVFSKVRAVAGQPSVLTIEKGPSFRGAISDTKQQVQSLPGGEYLARPISDGYAPGTVARSAEVVNTEYTDLGRRLASDDGLQEVVDGRKLRAGAFMLDRSAPIQPAIAGNPRAVRALLQVFGGKERPAKMTSGHEAPVAPRPTTTGFRGQTLAASDLRSPGHFIPNGALRIILTVLAAGLLYYLGWCVWDYYQWKHAFQILGIPVLGSLAGMPALGLGMVSANHSGWRKPVKTSTLLIIAGLLAGAIALGLLKYWL